MISRRRVSRVYLKELTDILRDRRTLAAMVIVPLVLYPLLMLGSVQAISVSAGDGARQSHVIGVDPLQERWLDHLPTRDTGEVSGDGLQTPPPEPKFVRVPESQLEQAVRGRSIHAGVVFKKMDVADPYRDQWTIQIVYDPDDFRSRSAGEWLREVLHRLAGRTVEWRMARLQVPMETLEPIVIEEKKVSTPGSVISHILPLILVLMTITGAIYPAIDLTAGERERGTLETLMVCPVPVIELIVGKFLVVATVAVVGAALNLLSVSATVYLGGFEQALSGRTQADGFPFAILPVVLLSLVPFSILFSAVMIAVCSYARTFKEAQNYITPVILAALIPGGIAALPTSELKGVLLVMPVANMVLLTRELLAGGAVPLGPMAWVLASTTLYAAAAVAVAARVFGAESVVFADSGSLRATFQRRMFQPTAQPPTTMGVLVVAVLFPIWFYIQAFFQSGNAASFARALRMSSMAMPVCFLVVPLLVLAWWKVDIFNTLRLARPSARHLAAGALLGLGLWIPATELSTLQTHVLPASESVRQVNETLVEALRAMPPWQVLLCLGLVPALCEEVIFRGFLLSSLRGAVRKWSAIAATACVFALFHFYFFKLPVTAALGIILGWLCWQSRSIWPGVVAHGLHNSLSAAITVAPSLAAWLRINTSDPAAHLPIPLMAAGAALVVAGIVLSATGKWGREC